MSKSNEDKIEKVSAIKVQQWFNEWDKVNYNAKEFQSRPKGDFFLFSMRARHLKALTGVYRRSAKGGASRVKDPNVQRGHEEERSDRIRDFVKFGFPWCEMSEAKRNSKNYDDLRKPGWLPTAIIVNILSPGEDRNGIRISDKDLIHVEDKNGHVSLVMPDRFSGSSWEPSSIYPLEVIDGQHRLWAFEDFDPGEYELPVVAFYGLDRGWQAYLFWSVNITPKRINKSLAFDLYPLLRQQTWLDAFTGHSIYRETRCQELVEALWAYPDSPWHLKINMLGESRDKREFKGASVTQAAWIRSLMASFVKEWSGNQDVLGGLFGASSQGKKSFVLPWTRPMQAAFLIYVGILLKDAVKGSSVPWIKDLRKHEDPYLDKDQDVAFYGEYSLITTDQGIRGFLFLINDLCFVSAAELNLSGWTWEDCEKKHKKSARKQVENVSAIDEDMIDACLASLKETQVAKFLTEIVEGVVSYDWRTSATPDLPEEVRKNQALFRGGSGYKEIRKQLVEHLISKKGRVASAAMAVYKALGY